MLNTDVFENRIQKHKIVERTKDSFIFCMENYINEEPDEFKELYKTLDINSLETKQCDIKLCINYEFSEGLKYVSSMLEISFAREVLGYYDCIFGLDGNIEDDYLRKS